MPIFSLRGESDPSKTEMHYFIVDIASMLGVTADEVSSWIKIISASEDKTVFEIVFPSPKVTAEFTVAVALEYNRTIADFHSGHLSTLPDEPLALVKCSTGCKCAHFDGLTSRPWPPEDVNGSQPFRKHTHTQSAKVHTLHPTTRANLCGRH